MSVASEGARRLAASAQLSRLLGRSRALSRRPEASTGTHRALAASMNALLCRPLSGTPLSPLRSTEHADEYESIAHGHRRSAEKLAANVAADARHAVGRAQPTAAESSVRALQRSVQDVTVVDDRDSAERVLKILTSPELRGVYHAWDTETMDIDPRRESPVSHGRVICLSAYCGPKVNFGNGPSLWINNLDEDILQLFRPYFADDSIAKVWHNYGFDRHMIERHGVECRGFRGDTMHMARLLDTSLLSYSLEELAMRYLKQAKTSIRTLFARRRVNRNGSVGKLMELRPLDEIQRSADDCVAWVKYSALDAKLTWELREKLHAELLLKKTFDMEGRESTLWEVYKRHIASFGELLTDIERAGIKIDTHKLAEAEHKAKQTIVELTAEFRRWLAERQPDAAELMNPMSDKQKQALFFAPLRNRKSKEVLPSVNEFKTTDKPVRTFRIEGFMLPFEETTPTGWPSTADSVLRELAGDASIGKVGKAKQKLGDSGCAAIERLCEAKTLSMLANTFLGPLQGFVADNGRIHASLNLNTETGRLSCRRPNLQNQPALDKDRVGIRKAFVCEKGNRLIVADYGQLELRVLAHISNCKSMLDAFRAGSDFHSRTAMGMYPYVQEAVNEGRVSLEGSADNACAPLLKDVFSLERRRAKVLNFSIAYGKTIRGLAKDWNVSVQEAEATLKSWYAARPEVLLWQQQTQDFALENLYVTTMLGRRRDLPKLRSSDAREWHHSMRAAINTPIQGSAADLVMAAMIKIWQHPRLAELGWCTVLQVHDEVVLEGPQETADDAAALVRHLMEHPFDRPLRVPLHVDLKVGTSWYDAK